MINTSMYDVCFDSYGLPRMEAYTLIHIMNQFSNHLQNCGSANLAAFRCKSVCDGFQYLAPELHWELMVAMGFAEPSDDPRECAADMSERDEDTNWPGHSDDCND